MAEEYSARARAARLEQEKPEVIADQTALLRISALMSDSEEARSDSQRAG